MSKPKTITIRIAVAVDEDGNWGIGGDSDINETDALAQAAEFCPGDSTTLARYWVTAEIPLPVVGEVAGTVEKAKEVHDA